MNEALEYKERIVVMGGSFNPPTIAHLRLLQAAMDGVQAQRGVFVPSSHAYVRRKMARGQGEKIVLTEALRLKMLEAMCEEDERLFVDDGEYAGGYSLDTMMRIKARFPEAELFFLFGVDKLNVFTRWKTYEAFVSQFRVIVFKRDGNDPAEEIQGNPKLAAHAEAFVVLPQPEGVEGISSTAVRARLRAGEPMDDLLHPRVSALLESDYEEEEKKIECFRGRYGFLSNFHQAPVTWEGLTYMNSEAAFQAAKCLDMAERVPFTEMDPTKAKRLGRKVALREDWETVKIQVMEEVVRAKFTQNEDLAAQLLETGQTELVEGNRWGDVFWGVDMRNGRGENHLGRILMKVRDELAHRND